MTCRVRHIRPTAQYRQGRSALIYCSLMRCPINTQCQPTGNHKPLPGQISRKSAGIAQPLSGGMTTADNADLRLIQ